MLGVSSPRAKERATLTRFASSGVHSPSRTTTVSPRFQSRQRVSGFSTLNVHRIELRHRLSTLQPLPTRSLTIENVTLEQSLSHQLLSSWSYAEREREAILKKILLLYISIDKSRIIFFSSKTHPRSRTGLVGRPSSP